MDFEQIKKTTDISNNPEALKSTTEISSNLECQKTLEKSVKKSTDFEVDFGNSSDQIFAKKHLQRAEHLANQNNLEKSIVACSQSLQYDPKLVMAYKLLGDNLAKIGKISEGITAYFQALAIASDDDNVYFKLSNLTVNKQEQNQIIAEYQKLVATQPESAEAYFYYAKTLAANQQWQSAIKYYQQVIDINSDFGEVYYYFGEALVQLEQWQSAADKLTVAVAVDCESSWAYHYLGIAQFQMEQWESAKIAFQQAIKLNADFSWSYFHLAETLTNQNLLESATKVYQRFLELESNFAYGYQRLGDVLSQQLAMNSQPESENLKAALQAYQCSMELEPDELLTYYKALQLNPKDKFWCHQLAKAYVRADKLVNAIIFYRLLLELGSDNATTHFELAQVLEKRNNILPAIKHYEIALHLEPAKAEYIDALKQLETKLDTSNPDGD